MYILQSTDNKKPHIAVREIFENKENFMELLLIGDEEENMVYKYLNASNLYVLYDFGVLKSACAILKKDDKTIEIKNLATYPKYQNQGYASFLLNFIFEKYKNFDCIILGTGENKKTLNFYKSFGFFEFDRVENFFIQNYSHPIFENGIQLKDMIYLKKIL